MTQENLANEMGVSIGAVSKWETGASIPDIPMLCALADFFHVSADYLLGREQRPTLSLLGSQSALRYLFGCTFPG